MKKSLTVACAAIFIFGTLIAAEKPAAKPAVSKAVQPAASVGNDFLSGWKDTWPDGTMTEAGVNFSNGMLNVSGISFVKSYGSVYKDIEVDFDRIPYLMVDVQSVTGFWYIVVRNSSLKEGYVRVQQDTKAVGKQVYNLRAATGLSGKQTLDIQLGISSGKDEPNLGKSVSFKDFRLESKVDGVIEGSLSTGLWKESWPDGTASGAAVKMNAGVITVAGTSKLNGYGSVYRTVTVNLDKTPVLKVFPSKVNGYWYAEAIGGALKTPVKIQPDSQSSGPLSYNLKELLSLSGVQSFELHLGVSSGGQDPALGKDVTFSQDVMFASVESEPQKNQTH